jgi:DNA-directed RNA polymerase subunit RPC12/RpoP
MTPCVLCHKEFEKEKLDFLERCDECFHKWMMTPENERVKLSKPFVPIYNGDKR